MRKNAGPTARVVGPRRAADAAARDARIPRARAIWPLAVVCFRVFARGLRVAAVLNALDTRLACALHIAVVSVVTIRHVAAGCALGARGALVLFCTRGLGLGFYCSSYTRKRNTSQVKYSM